MNAPRYAFALGGSLPGPRLGLPPPKATAREFLERFHDRNLEQLRPPRDDQKSFIFPSSAPVASLQQVQSGLVRRILKLYENAGQAQRIATVDEDATIIESHKEAAYRHYEGGRGYQPMVAVWAEMDLVLADEFRDGNVPAKQEPLTCAKLAFAALPETMTQRYFRGDSACRRERITGLAQTPGPAREEPGGRIGFAVSAVMSEPLAEAVRKVAEAEWKTFGKEDDGTLRQWRRWTSARRQDRAHESQPLRYVGLRLLKPQGGLFADGTDRHLHAVVTNEPTGRAAY